MKFIFDFQKLNLQQKKKHSNLFVCLTFIIECEMYTGFLAVLKLWFPHEKLEMKNRNFVFPRKKNKKKFTTKEIKTKMKPLELKGFKCRNKIKTIEKITTNKRCK